MPNLLDWFTNHPVILDGAWGTELQALGLRVGACPDQWNVTFPDRVQQVARSYVDAGSEVVLTNSFGANRIVLAGHGLADQTQQINREAVALSRAAAGEKARVFASMGPTGKRLAKGEVNPQDLSSVFSEQAYALAEGGAQGLVLETFTDLDELSIALCAAKSTGLPVVACMVFDFRTKEARSIMNATLERATTRLTELGADALGANCGSVMDAYIPVCETLRTLTKLPLWFKPNAGLPKIIDGKITYEVSPQQFAETAKLLVAKGAQFIGGCCGSNPAFITALVEGFAPPYR